MPARLRRGARQTAEASDEGPFVSFTDLIIGILFLFLILVAALMLMHQEAIQREQAERERMLEQIKILQAQLDAATKREAIPAFRLGIVFNIYQKPAGAEDWTFARTVQVFRAPDGHCVNNVLLRSNLSTAWKPPVEQKDIPTAAQQDKLRNIEKCDLTGAGDHWNTESETGSLKRVSSDLYSGGATLHKKTGDVQVEMQYRVLGVYDDYFRR